jgi:uncharacterized protein (TIGR03437 family)
MQRKKTILVAKFGAVLSAPALLWAFASGPDAHKTGVPGTGEPTCAQSQCHIGTPVNGGGGNVLITATSGTSYTPGQKQTLTLQITDSAARAYGFQATARLAGDRNQQAGTFTPGNRQLILCASSNTNDVGAVRSGAECPPNRPIEFIEHSAPFTTGSITVEWTPPATASGDVEIWVSANAANGDGSNLNDHIYNSSLTLSPAAAGPRPAVSQGGVINAAQFGAQAGVAPGTWIEIYGTNLSTTTREWAGGDFNGTTAPTSLDGVSVTIAGKPAFIRFISPGQINAQVPDDIGTGPVPLIVTNGSGASDPISVTASSALPGLLAPFNVARRRYVAALQGSTVVGSPQFSPVKPGDVVTLYGIGFGPVNPSIAAGRIAAGQNGLTQPFTMRIGQSQVTTSYRGLGPGFVGLYQFNITVPDLPDGDHAVTVDLAGMGTGQDIYLSVRR